MMNFALEMMGFAFKMMNSALKTNRYTTVQSERSAGKVRSLPFTTSTFHLSAILASLPPHTHTKMREKKEKKLASLASYFCSYFPGLWAKSSFSF